ncbi:inorganic pyrophosphatase [Lichtheimia corymbifera JMRC:FSU:9682]|uniref:inorganic diphosphatase n=1 Tax=Lichtheimia corymbifera JMRC:FSU:9682 TaxID=1263082 RepID=A0A068RG13_9FUNG|nr:inorganic pyrophosphatase [Lichtheimia corymbifera JMRC:FSU:9682]
MKLPSLLLATLLLLSSPKIAFTQEQPHCADIDCNYKLRTVGPKHTSDYAIYLENNEGTPISFFHDIPLQPSENVFNMVVEIPRWDNAKLETTKEVVMNPIKHDKNKDGSLRYVPNLFPINGYPANYGMIPKTWEDPYVLTESTKTYGDNDPIDVLELGCEVGFPGQIKQVKVLGGLILVDEGQTDWKIFTIDVRDPLASSMNDLDDIESNYPGFIDMVKNWFTVYKIPSTGKPNTLGFGGECIDKEEATKKVYEMHEYWKRLINGTVAEEDCKGIQRFTTTTVGSPFQVGPSSPQVNSVPEANPQPYTKPGVAVEKWAFLPAEWSFLDKAKDDDNV